MLFRSEMFVYLSFCPPEIEHHPAWGNSWPEPAQLYSPKWILKTFNWISKTDQGLPYKDDLIGIMEKLRAAWNPHYEDIEKLLGNIPCDSDCEVDTKLLHDDVLQQFRKDK